MILNLQTVIFSLVSLVSTQLTLENLLEVAEETGCPLTHPYSLVYGELFNTTYLQHNLRFCHPDLIISVKELEKTVELTPIEDRSKNPFVKAMILLFPSAAGEITTSVSNPRNFGHILDEIYKKFHAKQKGLDSTTKLLSFLLFYLCHPRIKNLEINTSFTEDKIYIDITGSEKWESIELDVGDVLTNGQNVLDLLDFFFDREGISSNNLSSSKSLLFQSFLVNFLIEKKELIMIQKQLKVYEEMFTNATDSSVHEINVKLLNGPRIAYEEYIHLNKAFVILIKDQVKKISEFPYSRNPIELMSVQFYNRKTNSFHQGSFSNCADIAIYHFLNCLLWNSNQGKYILKEEHKNTPIFKFFNESLIKRNPSRDQIMEWHRIVEDLENGKHFNPDLVSQFDTFEGAFNHVLYNKNTEKSLNEIKSGFINIFSVIRTIFGFTFSTEEMILFKNKFEYCHEDKFTQIMEKSFSKFLPEEQLKTIKSIKFTPGKNNCSPYKFEFFGTITITKETKGGQITFHLNIFNGHSYLKLDHAKQTIEETEERRTIINNIDSFGFYRYLIVDFLQFILTSKEKEVSVPFEAIFRKSIGFTLRENQETYQWMTEIKNSEMLRNDRKLVQKTFSNIICRMRIDNEIVFSSVDIFLYEFPDIPRPKIYKNMKLKNFLSRNSYIFFLEFLLYYSLTFEEELRKIFRHEKNSNFTENRKFEYLVSPKLDLEFFFVNYLLNYYRERFENHLENQKYFDIFFDSNDIFSDRILGYSVTLDFDSFCFDYMKEKYNKVVTDKNIENIDIKSFSDFYKNYLENRSRFGKQIKQKIDSFLVYFSFKLESNLFEELIEKKDFMLTISMKKFIILVSDEETMIKILGEIKKPEEELLRISYSYIFCTLELISAKKRASDILALFDPAFNNFCLESKFIRYCLIQCEFKFKENMWKGSFVSVQAGRLAIF